jgi:putative PIN family toxin of toxin-antitoxin system
MLSFMASLVIDTSVLVAAFISEQGASREVLRRCLQRRYLPMIGEALYREAEDVLHRTEIVDRCPLTASEREELFDAYLSVCQWVTPYYLFRPNLQDEADNHVVELAVAGNAAAIVTHNLIDFQRSELRFPELFTLNPAECLKRFP